MSRYRYQKGAGFERDLVDLFWENGWSAARVAGSGSVSHPVPDVFAIKDGRVVVVECKTTSGDRLSLKKAVKGLKKFQDISGGEAYIAVKFNRVEPRFYTLDSFKDRGNYTVTKNTNCIDFQVLLGRQERL